MMWWSWLPAKKTSRLPAIFRATTSKKPSAESKAFSTVEKRKS